MSAKNRSIVPVEIIQSKILFFRGHKVMLDRELAELYGVPTKRLNEQLKRNIKRFPPDFMFQLRKEEFKNLKSQFAASSWGGVRKMPYVFTEQGIAMLSSVLNSERAIQVNIQIIRTFTRLREMILSHKDLERKLKELEKKMDAQFRVVFEALEQLLEEPEPKPKRQIGFKVQ